MEDLCANWNQLTTSEAHDLPPLQALKRDLLKQLPLPDMPLNSVPAPDVTAKLILKFTQQAGVPQLIVGVTYLLHELIYLLQDDKNAQLKKWFKEATNIKILAHRS